MLKCLPRKADIDMAFKAEAEKIYAQSDSTEVFTDIVYNWVASSALT